MNPNASEQYFDYMRGLQPEIISVHPAAVVSTVNAPQHAANSPSFQESPEEHHAHTEAMQVVNQSLNFIMSGNKAMYISADMVQAIFSEMMKNVDAFKKERAAGNTNAITNLRANIGPGSHFARKHRNHLEMHHPNHPETHEPHADGKPENHVSGHGHEHHGQVVDPGLSHHFGDYPTVL